MSARLYWVLVEGVNDDGGFYQAYWAEGEHPGEAVAGALAAADEAGMRRPRASLLERIEDDVLPEDGLPTGVTGVVTDGQRHDFGLELTFSAPTGVVAAGSPTDEHPEAIVPGYDAASAGGDVLRVTAVVEEPDLLPAYAALLETFTPFRATWLRLAPDWEDEDAERYWLTESLTSADAVLAFLRDHPLDTIGNGHVTVTAYASEGATNVSLDEHKVLRVTTNDPACRDAAVRCIEGLGLPHLPELRSLQYDHHHWHYRLPGSRDRRALEAWLEQQGFREWDPREGDDEGEDGGPEARDGEDGGGDLGDGRDEGDPPDDAGTDPA